MMCCKIPSHDSDSIKSQIQSQESEPEIPFSDVLRVAGSGASRAVHIDGPVLVPSS